MHYSTRSFLGHPTDVSWSQYWENEPDDPVIRSSRGHLFGLINLEVESSASPSPLGHQLIQEINHAYFASTAEILPSLKQILESTIAKSEYQLPELTIILAVVHQNYLYLGTSNPGRVIFQRSVQISPILQGLSHQVCTLAGPIHAGDRFLLSSDAFFTQYGWDRLKTFLSCGKIQDVEENIMSLLYSLDRQPSLAAALIETHSDEPTHTSEVAVVDNNPTPAPAVLGPPKSQRDEGGSREGGRRPEGFFRKFFPRKPVYVGHHESLVASRRKKINLIFGILVLGILSGAIYLGSVRNHQSNLEKKYQSLKTQYQTKYDNALAIKNINLTESQSVAKDASKILGEMLLLKVHSDEISGLQSQINTLLSQTGSPDAYKPETFFDTNLIGANARYQLTFLSKGQLYLLDNNSGRLDQLDVSKKSYKNLIQNPDLSGVSSLAVENSQIFVLKNSQILEIRSGSVVPRFDAISQIPGLTSGQINLWNGSLYLLANPGSSPSVWKFTPSANGFSAGKNWLKDGQSLSADTTAFAINGSIWSLARTGQISSYNLGTKDKPVLNSTFTLNNATNLVTNPDTDVLAFANQNLVYLNKKSTNSVSSYNFGDKTILSLSLDASSKSLFILCSDQKIYKIGL